MQNATILNINAVFNSEWSLYQTCLFYFDTLGIFDNEYTTFYMNNSNILLDTTIQLQIIYIEYSPNFIFIINNTWIASPTPSPLSGNAQFIVADSGSINIFNLNV